MGYDSRDATELTGRLWDGPTVYIQLKRNDSMSKSSIVDLNSPTANMYGCEPCPKCGSKYRCVFQEKPDLIQCDDCKFNEEITERRND